MVGADPPRTFSDMAANSILLIEDEPDIREMLIFALERAGFDVLEAGSAEQALDILAGPLPRLLIIDWMLPGMSGVELARRLRRDPLTKDIPMLMLTARGEESDKLKSFHSGIDDYVTKPFSPKELIARIKALIRRAGIPNDGKTTAAGIEIDTNNYRLTVEGTIVEVAPTDFRLLELLMRHPDRVFNRTELLDRIWGRSVYVGERTIDVHVLRLRKLLSPFGRDQLIQTVRGVGYRFSTNDPKPIPR